MTRPRDRRRHFPPDFIPDRGCRDHAQHERGKRERDLDRDFCVEAKKCKDSSDLNWADRVP